MAALHRKLLRDLARLKGQAAAIGVVIGEPFAQAHDLAPGDTLTAIIDGRLERLTISGVGLSPTRPMRPTCSTGSGRPQGSRASARSMRITSPREAWEHLGDGYRVEARFVIWEGEDVVHIPISALFRDQDRWAVFVVEDSRARLRSVETGRRSGLRTQVESGLAPG
jgi:multidrug efflux pump subunit AcrA (membrane-fusion protein)